MRTLWAEDTASFHGEFTRFDGVRVYPKPVRDRRIPIVVGGNSDPALRRAAAFGDGWYAFYLRADEVAERTGALSGYCRENGRDLSKLTVAVALSNPHPDVLPELAAACVTEFVVAEAPPSAPAAAWRLGGRTGGPLGRLALAVTVPACSQVDLLAKPRTLLALGTGGEPGTGKVLQAMRSGDFCLPPGCSASYDVELADVLRTLTRAGARSALEDYCRSYADERGHRPSAVQAYEAGYNPASARAQHGHWFALLDDAGLLAEQERQVVRRPCRRTGRNRRRSRSPSPTNS